MTTVERDAATTAYEDVTYRLDTVAARFTKRYGGTYADWRRECDWLYLKAFTTHTPDRSAFETWVEWKCWKGLLEVLRTKCGRDNRLPRVYPDLEKTAATPLPASFDLEALLDSLSDDAKAVVRVTLAPPIAVKRLVRNRGPKTPQTTRLALIDFLKDSGWALGRILKSFSEIRSALSD